MAEIKIKAMTYEDSRLEYFTGARNFWTRRLAYFEKKIERKKKIHGELSYMDELYEKASDAAMKLGFYEDAIRLFELRDKNIVHI